MEILISYEKYATYSERSLLLYIYRSPQILEGH